MCLIWKIKNFNTFELRYFIFLKRITFKTVAKLLLNFVVNFWGLLSRKPCTRMKDNYLLSCDVPMLSEPAAAARVRSNSRAPDMRVRASLLWDKGGWRVACSTGVCAHPHRSATSGLLLFEAHQQFQQRPRVLGTASCNNNTVSFVYSTCCDLSDDWEWKQKLSSSVE